jgi:hypothetical protein
MDSANYKSFAIKEGVDPESLVRRPLTWEEFSVMGEAEKNWHLSENSKAVDAVYADNEKEVRQLKSLTKKQIDSVFNQTDLSHPAVRNTVENFNIFIARYPQYIHLPIHVTDIIVWLRKNSMLPEVDNIVTAWKALATEGKVSIDGSATGLVDETELHGKALEFHPQLNRLLEPVTQTVALSRRVMRMGDEEFKKWDRETHGSKELPPVILDQINKAFVTLVANHPDFRGTESDKTKLLDYIRKYSPTVDAKSVEAAFTALKAAGELDPNVIATSAHTTWTGYEQMEGRTYTEKQESLRRKINRMTDPEFVEFVNHSPANRRAVDNL